MNPVPSHSHGTIDMQWIKADTIICFVLRDIVSVQRVLLSARKKFLDLILTMVWRNLLLQIYVEEQGNVAKRSILQVPQLHPQNSENIIHISAVDSMLHIKPFQIPLSKVTFRRSHIEQQNLYARTLLQHHRLATSG